MGRWLTRAGIAAWAVRAANRLALRESVSQRMSIGRKESTHKKMTPPREKNAEVASGRRKKTVPMITAWMTKVLSTD